MENNLKKVVVNNHPVTIAKSSAHFGQMAWPRANDVNDEIQWKLRYQPETLTKSEQLIAASIITAYFSLIYKSQKNRNYVAGVLKKIERIK